MRESYGSTRDSCPRCKGYAVAEHYFSAARGEHLYYLYCPTCRIYTKDCTSQEEALGEWRRLVREMKEKPRHA